MSTGRRARLPLDASEPGRAFWLPVFAGLLLLLASQPNAAAPAIAPDLMALAQDSRAVAARGDLQGALTLAEQARDRVEARLAQAAEPQLQALLAYLEDDSAGYLLRLGRGAEALAISERAVQRIAEVAGDNSPEFGALAATLGTVRIASGSVESGIATLESAYASLPDGNRRARVALGLARTHALASRLSLEAAWLDRAAAAGPNEQIGRWIAVARVEHAIATGELQVARQRLDALLQSANLSQTDRLRSASSLALAEGRLGEAETALLQLLELQVDDVEDSLLTRSRLGHVYVLMGRIVEAQEVYRDLLGAAVDAGLAASHPLIGRTLHALAITYKSLGEYEEAALLYDRAVQTLGDSLGETSEAVARSRLELSRLLTAMTDYDGAEREARAALAILSGAGLEHAEGLALSSLAFALKAAGRDADARREFERAITLLEAADGPLSPDLPPGLLALAELEHAAGRRNQALSGVDRAIAMLERMNSNSLSGLASAFVLKAMILADENAGEALVLADRSLDVVDAELAENTDQRLLNAISESRSIFERYLEVVGPNARSTEARQRMLMAAQYPKLSLVAATISQTAERGVAGNDELADLLEERQRLSVNLAELETRRERELAGLQAEAPDGATERERQAAREALTDLGDRIGRSFPAFAERAFPRPVTALALQRHLADDEAVFTLLSGNRRTYLFLALPNTLEVRALDLPGADIESLVARVRRTLRFADDGSLTEFDADAAHQLYLQLIAPFAGELADVQHLIYVPDRTLVGLPLGLLVTRLASGDQPVEYLQSSLALSSMPSLSSLVALRDSRPRQSREARLLGVGHPVLGGAAVQASALDLPRSLVANATPSVHELLVPLANTVLEINEIASTFDEGTLLFQEQASEARLYALPDLDTYSVVVFATHGLLRDDTVGVPEPALVLSPDDQHDGLLLASEVAGLSLNADWVVLSACNTAGPDGTPRAEGLSGLAKAFFFAGARALLVSHWEVNSSAAVLITTRSMARYRERQGAGKARALQQALQAFIEGEYGQAATHPAYWAPFVLVGDGAV